MRVLAAIGDAALSVGVLLSRQRAWPLLKTLRPALPRAERSAGTALLRGGTVGKQTLEETKAV